MFRSFAGAAVLAGVVLVPTAAQATYFPGEDSGWLECTATSFKVSVRGVCTEDLSTTVASRTELVGGALVSYRDLTVGFTGQGVASGSSAESTAYVGWLRINAVGLTVIAERVEASESSACVDGRRVASGAFHIGRLTVNGTTYTDIDDPRELTNAFGKVALGAVERDEYLSSMDPTEGESRAALSVTGLAAGVVAGNVGVTNWDFAGC